MFDFKPRRFDASKYAMLVGGTRRRLPAWHCAPRCALKPPDPGPSPFRTSLPSSSPTLPRLWCERWSASWQLCCSSGRWGGRAAQRTTSSAPWMLSTVGLLLPLRLPPHLLPVHPLGGGCWEAAGWGSRVGCVLASHGCACLGWPGPVLRAPQGQASACGAGPSQPPSLCVPSPPFTPTSPPLLQRAEGILLLDLRAASWQVLYANDSFRDVTGLPHLLAPGRQDSGAPVDFWRLFAHASADTSGEYKVCAGGEGGGGRGRPGLFARRQCCRL